MQKKRKAVRVGRECVMAFCSLAAAAVAMLIFAAVLSLRFLPVQSGGSTPETSGTPETQNTASGDKEPP